MRPKIKGRYHVKLDPFTGLVIGRFRCLQCDQTGLTTFGDDLKEAEIMVKDYLDSHLMQDCPETLEGDWHDWPMYEWNEVISNVGR